MHAANKYLKGYKDAALAGSFRRFFIQTLLLVAVFIAAIFLIYYNQNKVLATNQSLINAKDLIFQSEKTISLVKDYETNARGFIISGNDDFLALIRGTKDSTAISLQQLRQLSLDNPQQLSAVDSLEKYISLRFAVSDSGIFLSRNQGQPAALNYVATGTGKNIMDTIRHIQQRIHLREDSVLKQRYTDDLQASSNNRYTLFVTLIVFFILLLVLFWQAWFNLNKYNTRQQEINEMLRQLTLSLKNAQKVARMGSWEWNISTDEQKWSDEQFRLFGYEPGEIKPTHKFFLEAVHPVDREIVEREITEALKKRQPYDITCLIVQPNGDIRHINLLGEVYLENENQVIIAGTAQDITQKS